MAIRTVTIKLRIGSTGDTRPTPAQCANLINLQALDNLLSTPANGQGVYLSSYMADGGYTGAEREEMGDGAVRNAVRCRGRTVPP